MSYSFRPLIIAGLVVGLLVGGGIGAGLGKVFLPPACPACPDPPPTPTPVICPECGENPESAYYRGYIAACVQIGMKMQVPQATVAQVCADAMGEAYINDFFSELMPDNWTWPPVTPTPQPPPVKKSTAAP